MLGVGMLFVGIGCVIVFVILCVVVVVCGGDLFDVISLIEDYEFGLWIVELGVCGVFVWIDDGDGGIVVVCVYFFGMMDVVVC